MGNQRKRKKLVQQQYHDLFFSRMEEYAINIQRVKEIHRVHHGHQGAQKVPEWIRGVINLRGNVVPGCGPGGALRNLKEAADKPRTTLHRDRGDPSKTLNGTVMGVLADAVNQVHRSRFPRIIEEPPAFGDAPLAAGVSLRDGQNSVRKFALILNIDKRLEQQHRVV